jgi:small subunit ribosomal protein S17
MPRKKKEEEIEAAQADAVETETDESAEIKTESAAEEKPKKAGKKKAAAEEEHGLVETVVDTVAAVAGTVAGVVAETVSTVVSAVTGSSDDKGVKRSKRAEKIGVVKSDKMTKTVTVRVDRVVKHPVYRKYVKRRKNFMAHDEMGATVGDKVRIIETRPLSARKRWRVVEIIQKAEK